MTTKDIELLFENELGIEEVCVWSYDEKSKTLDMHFEIDFSPITKEGTPFTNYLFVNKESNLFMKIFDLVEEGLLDYRSIEIKNNKLNMNATTKKEKELEKILQVFFNKFLFVHKIF